jgi:SNF2 family DNA or RNA helicase
MEVIENRAVAVRVKRPAHILAAIPKSRLLPDGRVLVHWGVDEMRVLQNLGVKSAPSPIMRDYNWPGMYKPFEHQKTVAAFLTMHSRAFNFGEQGTGKTMSAAWAADYLMEKGLIKRVLIVCPVSVMDNAWRSDLFKTLMHRRVDIAHGSAEQRRKVIQGNAEFVIINYDGVPIMMEYLMLAGFDLVIADEANAVKTTSTRRWKSMAKLVKPNTWLWMMTGTPAAQSPVDAYGLAKLVNPNGVPRFFNGFREQVMQKVTNFKYIPRPNAKDIVHAALQPAIRFTKKECLDLPEITYVTRHVPMTQQQKHYYDEFRKHMLISAAGEQITAANAAVKLNRLLQIASGASYTESGAILDYDISNRYRVLEEVISETDRKVLVFVMYTHAIQALQSRLKEDGYTVGVINGAVSAGERTRLFRAFQDDPDPRILIIQPQSAAHGVTLTAADTIVWWGPTSSLEIYAQANARPHRAGQKFPCTVVRLEGAPVERHVYSMLDNNIDVHTQIVEMYRKLLD